MDKSCDEALPAPIRRVFYMSSEGETHEHEVAPPPNPQVGVRLRAWVGCGTGAGVGEGGGVGRLEGQHAQPLLLPQLLCALHLSKQWRCCWAHLCSNAGPPPAASCKC